MRSTEAAPGRLRVEVDIDGGEREVTLTADPPLASSTDGAVPVVLLPAMTVGAPLRIAEPVDPFLLERLPDIQAIFRSWSDEWPYLGALPREIDVVASAADPPQASGCREVAAFFSGGVDSFSTVLSHPEITHLIFVIGLDISPEDTELAGRVVERLADAATRLDKSWVVVETDARRFGDEFVPWVGYFGSILASVARMLAPGFSRAYIASEAPYQGLYRRGSHPLVDHLWGSPALELIHDGSRFTRAEKIERIAGDEVARRALRVCWENRDSDYNCCRCEKCVRTMVTLEALGVLGRFDTFPAALDRDRVAAIVPDQPIARDFWRENLALALRTDDRGLVSAIEACLANVEREPQTDRLAELEDLVEQQRDALDAVQRSASWRLTAPLRRVKSVVAKTRRGSD